VEDEGRQGPRSEEHLGDAVELCSLEAPIDQGERVSADVDAIGIFEKPLRRCHRVAVRDAAAHQERLRVIRPSETSLGWTIDGISDERRSPGMSERVSGGEGSR
jgi:hypothetical protein